MSVMAPLQAAPAKPQAASASAARGVLQRKCDCGSSKSLPEGRDDEFPSRPLQRKLAIGASNDPLEKEADRIAAQVLAVPAHAAVSGTPARIQRLAGQPAGETATAPASVDHALTNPGRPLEPALRQDMERRFGHDFSRVRVHTGAAAERSARDVNANAYATGQHIVFAAGRFAPETRDGRKLIAHELTHVVQQSVAPRQQVLCNGHTRAPVLEPGTGFDGIRQPYGTVVDRSLTADQVKAVKDYRAWMEAGFTEKSGYAKGNWAREAGTRAAAFPGDARARASLYAEFQRQIVQATGGAGSDWYVSAERGADRSYIFRGNPALEAKIFVVDPQGNSYVGDAKEGLKGRGAGKTVNYPKLWAIGVKTPTGGAAPAPKVVPVTPAPVTPPSGEITVPKGGKPPAKVTGSGVMKVGVANVALVVVFLWLGKKAAEEEQQSIKKLIAKQLDPAVEQALIDQAAAIDRLAKDPSQTCYANVTADFRYEWTESGIGRNRSMKHLAEIKLVAMKASRQWVDTKRQLEDDCSGWGQVQNCWEIVRVTYPQVVFDPDYEAEKARRLKSREEYLVKHPEWRLKPAPAGGEFEKRRWVSAVKEIQQWYADRKLAGWLKAMEAERERKRARIEVISVPK